MATTQSHNKKSSSVKRILSEARELSSDTSTLYHAAPLEDNIFEWHFTLRGPPSTEFSQGLYHGRILLPAEYPMRPPNLMLLTPNGRWELNKKICLTFTGFHEEMWQPAWGIRTALLGLQTFMSAKAEQAVGIGSLEFSVETRERLARESRGWKCGVCERCNEELLPDPVEGEEEKKEEETLPEGLVVDLSAKSHKPEQCDGGAPSKEVAQPITGRLGESSASQESIPAPPTILASGSTSSSSLEVTPAPAPAPVAASQSHQRRTRPFAAPAIPPRSTSTNTAQPTNLPTPPAPARVSPTEQKLVLIDNCIKGLSVLVALLVVKRLL